MNLYTHAVLAERLRPLVRPTDAAEYLWGAVAPDVRYLAGLRRETTHLPDEVIASWFDRYPGCASFIQGYRVHCLLDRIDMARVIGRAFPLNLLGWARRRPFSPRQMAVAVELYYHQTVHQGFTLAGDQNAILAELGIHGEQAATYRLALAEYLASPSFQTAIETFATLGIVEDERIEKYLNAYWRIEGNTLAKWMLVTSVKNARLEEIVVGAWNRTIYDR